MKTMNCDLCDHEVAGETFEEWMNALKPHYMQMHADVMRQHMADPAKAKEMMGKWMADNKARFEALTAE